MKGIASGGKTIKFLLQQILLKCKYRSKVDRTMVYPTSISVKKYRECFKVDKGYTYYGEKTLLRSANPPLLTSSEVRFALVVLH